GVEFSPDGTLLASCSNAGRIRLHDREGRLVGEWHAQKAVNSVRFLPDGSRVATAGWNQFVQIWNLEGKELHSWRGHLNGLTDVACSVDGRLASVSWDGTARIWSDHSRGSRMFSVVADSVRRFAVAPDGSRVLAAGRFGEVVLADADSKVIWRRHLHAGEPVAATFDVEGKHVLVAYDDGALFHSSRDEDMWVRIDTGLSLCGGVFLPSSDRVVLAAFKGIFGLT